jgi:hypothetical protein
MGNPQEAANARRRALDEVFEEFDATVDAAKAEELRAFQGAMAYNRPREWSEVEKTVASGGAMRKETIQRTISLAHDDSGAKWNLAGAIGNFHMPKADGSIPETQPANHHAVTLEVQAELSPLATIADHWNVRRALGIELAYADQRKPLVVPLRKLLVPSPRLVASGQDAAATSVVAPFGESYVLPTRDMPVCLGNEAVGWRIVLLPGQTLAGNPSAVLLQLIVEARQLVWQPVSRK